MFVGKLKEGIHLWKIGVDERISVPENTAVFRTLNNNERKKKIL
jgi:hypothetical protein